MGICDERAESRFSMSKQIFDKDAAREGIEANMEGPREMREQKG